MKFLDLYQGCRDSAVKALRELWCAEAANESQRAYAARIEALLPGLVAPENAVPLVQCMNMYKAVHSVGLEEAEALVGGMWKKATGGAYAPYEHQYRCWKALTETTAEGKVKSICVTTGTGSGKTECFMLPLVRDLEKLREANPNGERKVRALFLYPLNALMEDQKERLEKLLEGTGLKYAVYNGDLPESEPGPNDHSEEAEKVRARIRQIRGYDEKTGECRFGNALYTREQVRKEAPEILLTNPTMLEYVLLRKKDEKLIDRAAKSLRWVAIDETHTYTGAGAAELAMLLRRVILAFGVKAEEVRFATSSATFGNGPGDEKKLKGFIAGITGTGESQIEVVGGERAGGNALPENEDRGRWEKIWREEYARADALFPGEKTVEGQLGALDAMVERLGGRTDMKVKVHYFNRVPNNGVWVKLGEIEGDGTFRMYTECGDAKEGEGEPPIELARCRKCGEYVAAVRRNGDTGEYHGFEPDESDLFDLDEEPEKKGEETKVFGLAKGRSVKGSGNSAYVLKEGKLEPALPGEVDLEKWHLVANQHVRCPYCNGALAKGGEERDAQAALEDGDGGRLRKFRASAEFVSRLMAPEVLDRLERHEGPGGEELPHRGQQYLSFADSRQQAARSTLRQNMEQERTWFYATTYHELCRRAAGGAAEEVEELKRRMAEAMARGDMNEAIGLGAEIKEAQKRAAAGGSISWGELAKLLEGSEWCGRFCDAFAKRTGGSDETDAEGAATGETKKKYVQSIMAMYLTSRPRVKAAPETMGLFVPCYKKLEEVKAVPPRVENTFNRAIKNAENRIGLEDWKNLLQTFIDYRVRSDQSVYLEQEGVDEKEKVDIFGTVRFAAEKPHRKPAKKPKVEKGKCGSSRVVRQLCALLRRDDPGLADDEAAYGKHYDAINVTVDAMWHDLTKTTKLLQLGRQKKNRSREWTSDPKGGERLNLADMSFRLYRKAWMCDANQENEGEANHAEALRPVEVNFKGFSPYLRGGVAVDLDEGTYGEWEAYPYYAGSGKELKTAEELWAWAKEKRANAWGGKGIWGEGGTFAERLRKVHLWPDLFIQAEHTAQVDKGVSRKLQKDFKEHRINVLACSTTMEMGVDLGTLELVVLGSVPPQPANYKQRAGRSGRNPKMVRSACITLCGSDAIGMRTLANPMETIIDRKVETPKVDLESPQVVQRHANSFLVRSLGVFGGGSVNQRALDYYTTFRVERRSDGWFVFDRENRVQDPTTKLGDPAGTKYEEFGEKCDPAKIGEETKAELGELLKGTVFEGKEGEVIETARRENERCYRELAERLEDVRCAYVECKGESEREKRFRRKLNFEYMEALNERLLGYWATRRFTPNANMPVSVLELDLDPLGNKGWRPGAGDSNPSYTLREAISQYAPGSSVVADGVVYAARGVKFENRYRGASAFKRLARNADETVTGERVKTLEGKREWWEGTGKYEIELVEPAGFITDSSEERTRIIESGRLTHVSAQLIGAKEWDGSGGGGKLWMVRCNRDSGDAKILYCNEGVGYGYCLCMKCGRMALETEVCPGGATEKLPQDFNKIVPVKTNPATGETERDEDAPRYHYAIMGKEARKRCCGSNDEKAIRRNAIIGGLLQTDFSEIKIRHKGKQWIHDRTSERGLLTTLGIVLAQALVEILGKERNAVDFAILPYGHLCIFDANPGGAGYSNQLAAEGMMEKALAKAKELLETAKAMKSKDWLLDKYTLRYMRWVDVDAALGWMAEG